MALPGQSDGGDVLHQVTKREGMMKRVPPGETPVLELHLAPGQYIAGVTFEKQWLVSERKTDDWRWTAYVVTPLP